MLVGSNRKPLGSFADLRTKLKRPFANRKKNSLVTLLILVVVGVLAMVDLKELQLARFKMSRSATKIKGKETRGATANDGCGLVNNHYSSKWITLSESENEDVEKLRECLNRTVPGSWPGAEGYHNITPRAFRGQLSCSTHVTFDTVRSALSQYKTVWMHGDSLMAQTFYTLGCMMNSSMEEWNGTRISEILSATGLGYNGPEQFTYTHSLGSTKFMYSRFGKVWGLDKNLYEDDFPLAMRTLTSHDAIVTNGAAVHNNADAGSKFERDVDFIAKHSKMTNATTFFFEPTADEWPTSNGMYANPGLETCQCHPLSNAQLLGVERNYTCDDVTPGRYRRIRPDSSLNHLYPDSDLFLGLGGLKGKGIDSDYCIPNCVPNHWRSDVVRQGINKTSAHNIHIVPIYWQLVSRFGGSFKTDGDCTHKDVYATIAILFQWTRTVLALQQDI